MATRWEALVALGGLTLIVGPLLLLAAAMNLRGAPDRRRGRRGLAATLVLAANFPAAAFAVWAANDVMTSFTVTVRNESPRTLEEVLVTGPGLRERIGALEPGRSATVRIRPGGPGILDVEWTGEGGHESAAAETYVTSGLEGHIAVTVPAQGAPAVHHSPRALGWFQSAP